MADEDKTHLSPLAQRIAYHCCEYHDLEEFGPCDMPHDITGRVAQAYISKHRFVLNDMVEMLKHLVEDPSLFDKDTTYLWVEALEYIVNDMTKASDLKTEGWVYFIQCGEYVKIGLSSNVESRLKALQSATPYPLKLLKKLPVPNMARAEARLHRHFASVRHKGEWFRLTEDDLWEVMSFESIDVWYLEDNDDGNTQESKERGQQVHDDQSEVSPGQEPDISSERLASLYSQ